MAMLVRRFIASAAFVIVVGVVSAAAAVHAAEHTVDVKTKSGVGSYLVDSKGSTLYRFDKDASGKSACAGPCLEKWPPFYIDEAVVPESLNAGDFGTITRADGKKQTTFKGMPLYYFIGDKKAGDTNGHGVKDIWHVVNP